MSDMRAALARVLALGAALFLLGSSPAGATPERTPPLALHLTPANPWLAPPAEGHSTTTPRCLRGARPGGLTGPGPGCGSARSLAESWSMAKGGLSADFL